MISVAAGRQRITDAIVAALPTWRPSTVPADRFGEAEGEGLFHQCFAVGARSTTPAPTTDQRQRSSEGLLVDTVYFIPWSFELGANDQVNTYDDGLAAEALLIKACDNVVRTGGFLVRFQSASRDVDASGFLQGTIELRARHQLAFE